MNGADDPADGIDEFAAAPEDGETVEDGEAVRVALASAVAAVLALGGSVVTAACSPFPAFALSIPTAQAMLCSAVSGRRACSASLPD